MPNGKVKVGIIGSQFEADIHAASFQIMPEEAEVVAVASPTPGNAEALAKKIWHPARLPRLSRNAARARHRDGHHHGAQLAARADDHRRSASEEARRLREAAVHDPRGSGRDDRRLPARGRPVDVRRGAVLHAQIRPRQADGRPGRVRQGVPGKAEREALRPAQPVVLGHGSRRAAAR